MRRSLIVALCLASCAWAQPSATPSPVHLGPSPTATAAPSAPPSATPTPANNDASISVSSDRQAVEIGQSIRVQVEISYGEGVEVTPIEPEKWTLKPFELQDAALARLPEEGGRQRVRYTLRVAAFEEGEVTFPSLPLNYSKDGVAGKVESKPFQVMVGRVSAGKDDKPGEIRDLKPLAQSDFPPLLLVALVLAGALLAWLLYRLVAWLRRPRPKAAQPALPPFELARRELARLERERLWEGGQMELYYDQLHLVLRTYLGWRFGVTLLEKTSEETLALLKDKEGLSYDNWRTFKGNLEDGDLVKFARLHPPAERPPQHLEQAKTLVESHPPLEVKGK